MGHRGIELQDLYNELSEDVARFSWQDLHFADIEPADALAVCDNIINYSWLHRCDRLGKVVEGELFKALLSDVLLTQQHLEDSICHFG